MSKSKKEGKVMTVTVTKRKHEKNKYAVSIDSIQRGVLYKSLLIARNQANMIREEAASHNIETKYWEFI